MAVRIVTDERCLDYHSPGHPERPARISASLQLLHAQKEIKIDWTPASRATDESLLRAHSAAHLARLRIPHDFDGDTPYHDGIEEFARASAAAALQALQF